MTRPGRVLMVFLKYPEPGLVKSRLAEGAGAEVACRLYRHMASRTLAAARLVRARTVVYADPPDRVPDCARVFGDRAAASGRSARLAWKGQAPGDLGWRIETAFRREAVRRPVSIVAIGTDCPGLDSGRIRLAFETLRHSEAVLGPAVDGGYYLIGFRFSQAGLGPDAVRAVFRGIPWSGSSVYRETARRLHRAGIRTQVLEKLRDLDVSSDFDRALIERLFPML